MSERKWREQVIANASEYVKVTWTPTQHNVFHGIDENGVQVNTPDSSFASKVWDCAWWKDGESNQGVAYNWGGASTVEQFATGIAEGKYAGNVPDSRKNGVSKQCVGVDCSGLVSNCWCLPKKLSTREFENISHKLTAFSELRKGDILLLPGSHVMIFVEFQDHAKVHIIDSTRATGRVMERTVSISELCGNGYAGYTPVPDVIKRIEKEEKLLRKNLVISNVS